MNPTKRPRTAAAPPATDTPATDTPATPRRRRPRIRPTIPPAFLGALDAIGRVVDRRMLAAAATAHVNELLAEELTAATVQEIVERLMAENAR